MHFMYKITRGMRQSNRACINRDIREGAMIQYQKSNDVLNTVNRGNPAESGLCTLCRADCRGRCETWTSAMKGRKLLYPRDFGAVTAGSSNINHVGVCYTNLRIQGYHYGCRWGGAQGQPAWQWSDPTVRVAGPRDFGREVRHIE